ncbi:uncharacterized protein LOC115891165 [Sitophilus oryzae]|uniref:pyridoxal 5'-phosphate synthase n=1 Tax=Sitophilus oryzae TaxID=7048 RepID=A0A6J2YW66_SITOR|nr:uncharacterized protein LOC115891165 [Sitophilus oryzae]
MNITIKRILPITRYTKRFARMSSGLSYIDVPENCQPSNLFKQWADDYKKYTHSGIVLFNLATSFKNGDVANRTLALQEISDDDGLIFHAKFNSLKVKQIEENPKASVSFLFTYTNETSNKRISQQVRMKGFIEKLPPSYSDKIFEKQPLFAKLRSVLIEEQGVPVCWEELKKKHDDLLDKVNKGEIKLKTPKQLVLYKIMPVKYDFYHANENEIGDRILFSKSKDDKWDHYHVTA